MRTGVLAASYGSNLRRRGPEQTGEVSPLLSVMLRSMAERQYAAQTGLSLFLRQLYLIASSPIRPWGSRGGQIAAAKDKRGEREIVTLARSAGLPATRTWHTAQDADPLIRCRDVVICGHSAQVRVRANGFKPVYDALEGVEIAFLRGDREP